MDNFHIDINHLIIIIFHFFYWSNRVDDVENIHASLFILLYTWEKVNPNWWFITL